MNRDVTGVNGQLVTTWGGDLYPGTDIWIPGSDRPQTTTITCRCGHSEKMSGWGIKIEERTTFRVYFSTSRSWLNNEYFCSQKCWIKFEPDQAVKQIAKLNEQIEWSKNGIASIQKDLGI